MEFFVNTEITYYCPTGHVFQIPEIYGNGTSVLKLKCEPYAAWNPDLIPKCVRKEQSKKLVFTQKNISYL